MLSINALIFTIIVITGIIHHKSLLISCYHDAFLSANIQQLSTIQVFSGFTVIPLLNNRTVISPFISPSKR